MKTILPRHMRVRFSGRAWSADMVVQDGHVIAAQGLMDWANGRSYSHVTRVGTHEGWSIQENPYDAPTGG